MKKLLLAGLLLSSTNLLATDDNLCTSGGCSNDISQQQQQGMTDINSPTFNSTPQMQMAGSNVAIQNMNDSYTRMGDIQCPNSTVNLGLYGGRQTSENDFNYYSTQSENYGAQGNLSIPIGSEVKKCGQAQDVVLKEMNFKYTSNIVKMCMEMIASGFQVSDQLKNTKGYENFKVCDHFRQMKQQNPYNYQEAQRQVTLATAPQKPVEKPKTVTKVIGHKEYRLWLGNFSGCVRCGDDYKSVKKDLINKGIPLKNIYIIPFEGEDGKMLFSVNIRDNFLTLNSASNAKKVLQQSKDIHTVVRPVKGTEIKKTIVIGGE